jgi:Excreted virulence factor EspC, type VII ESX diderm
MGEIRVDPGTLRSAGGVAESAGADLRGLAGEVSAALSGVGGSAPAETSGAASAFSNALQVGALAIGDGVSALGANAGTAADVYEQVDRQAMP